MCLKFYFYSNKLADGAVLCIIFILVLLPSLKEGVSGTKHFYWFPLHGKGNFLFHFIMFLCVHQIPVISTKAINDIFLSRCFEMHKVGNFSPAKFSDNC